MSKTAELIDALIEQHEVYKQKGIRLTTEDLFNWNGLLESMLDIRTELISEYQETKQQLDMEEGLEFIKLQNEKIDVVNKKGETESKNKYTVDSAKAVLSELFFDRRKDLQAMKLRTELLQNKTSVIPEYINLGKRFLPTNYNQGQ